jgi:cobaltochelatase CobS
MDKRTNDMTTAYDHIVLGRDGKNELRKAVRAHSGWKQFAADNDITQRQPTKAEILEYADMNGIDVTPFVADTTGIARSPVAAAANIVADMIDDDDADQSTICDDLAVDLPDADQPTPVDEHDQPDPVADILQDVAPFMNDGIVSSLTDKIRSTLDATRQAAYDDGYAIGTDHAVVNAPAASANGSTPVAKSLPVARRAGQTATLRKLFGVAVDGDVQMWTAIDAPAIDPDYVFDPAMTRDAALFIEAGRNVWFGGPKGCGKTTWATQYAARVKRPLVRIGFHRYTDPQELIGGMGLKDGSTFFQPGALLVAIQRPGCIVLLDEPDRAPGSTQTFMQTLLDERYLINPATGERVDCADGVVFVAAGNTLGSGDDTGLYTAANELDAATIARFDIVIDCDWLSEARERKALAAKAGVKPVQVERLTKFAALTRKAFRNGDNGDALSFRELDRLAFAIKAGMPAKRAFETIVENAMRPAYALKIRELRNADLDLDMLEHDLRGTTPAQPATGTITTTPDGLSDHERDLLANV